MKKIFLYSLLIFTSLLYSNQVHSDILQKNYRELKLIRENEADSLQCVDSLYVLYKNSQIGLFEPDGTCIVPIRYSKIKEFGNWYLVYNNDSVGISNYGIEIIAPKYSDISYEDVAGYKLFTCHNGNKYDLYNSDGVLMFSKDNLLSFDISCYTEYGILLKLKFIKKCGKDGYYNTDGSFMFKENNIELAEKYAEKGHYFFDKGKYLRAARKFKKAFKLHQIAIYALNAGNAYYNKQWYITARRFYRQSLRYDNEDLYSDKLHDNIHDCNKAIKKRRKKRWNDFYTVLFAMFPGLAGNTPYASSYSNSYTGNMAYYNPSGMNYLIDPQYAMAQAQAQVQHEENNFLNGYTTNFQRTWGREPTEQEKLSALTSYHSAKSGHSESSSSIDTSSSSSEHTYSASSSDNYSTTTSRTCTKLMATDLAHCNGTGKCSKCNGRGHYTDYTFGNANLVDPCVTCGGNGKCPSCHGTGKLR